MTLPFLTVCKGRGVIARVGLNTSFNRWGWTVRESIFECSNRNLVHGIHYHKFAILHEETSPPLTFLFTSLKIEINPFRIRQMTESKQVFIILSLYVNFFV